jgi:hypothetical protein
VAQRLLRLPKRQAEDASDITFEQENPVKKLVFAAALLAIGASAQAASHVMDGVTVHVRHGHEGSQLKVHRMHKDPTRFAGSVKADDTATAPTAAAPMEPAATNAAPAK